MDIYIYRLEFKGSTHFGDTGIELENVTERVNSDTLFSALINAMNILYKQEKTDTFIKCFIENPPFIISSLFLYSGDTFYLPRPFVDGQLKEELKRELGKELKKIMWLSDTMFLKWISGDEFNENDVEVMKDDLENYKKAYTIEIRPRVSLDRSTQNSNLYHCGYVYFKKNSGLYGFVAFRDSNAVELFQNILTNLGEIGLGGEKTYGSGTFKVIDFKKINGVFLKIFRTNLSQYVLLSLYHPSSSEIGSLREGIVAYDIVRKKGWITSGKNALPLKRKSVGFFVEGSVFKGCPNGCLVDVTPDSDLNLAIKHKIFRYGYAFTAPTGG